MQFICGVVYLYKNKPMLTQKISKKVQTNQEKYMIWLGIIGTMTDFKFPEQERKILSYILSEGELTKNVRDSLHKLTTEARVGNVISKFRKEKILIGDKPNFKYPVSLEGEVKFNIILKND